MNAQPDSPNAGTTLTEFRMPSLGADMESGVLLEWLVGVGDTVHKGDVVAVVDTSKAAVEVECFASGVVRRLLVEPGASVPVGQPLATIESHEGAASALGSTAPARPAPPAPPAPPVVASTAGAVVSPLVRKLAAELHVDTTTIVGSGAHGRITHGDVLRQTRPPATTGRVKASPLARRVAGELGVALDTVRGTGPDGAIQVEDVRGAFGPSSAQPSQGAPRDEPSQRGRTDALRATIAARMARSKREIPHYYLTEQIDLGPAMDWLHERNRTLAVSQRLVPSVMLLKATARAAALVPELNGFWEADRFSGAKAVHLGVAVSLRGGGLVAPAIHDADQLDLPELMAALRDLVARTRAGRLRGSELADPTITVSNLGDQGVESILGVIYPPQVALVGFGRVVDRPWAVAGMIGVRPIVTASLAADHRATDGATGARFLQSIARLLEQPEEL